MIANMDGTAIHKSEDIQVSHHLPPWGVELSLDLDAPLQPGWYRFSFTQVLDAVVRGIVLYAE
jgi:hypothetical protein